MTTEVLFPQTETSPIHIPLITQPPIAHIIQCPCARCHKRREAAREAQREWNARRAREASAAYEALEAAQAAYNDLWKHRLMVCVWVFVGALLLVGIVHACAAPLSTAAERMLP
jgi:hypothetical protein